MNGQWFGSSMFGSWWGGETAAPTKPGGATSGADRARKARIKNQNEAILMVVVQAVIEDMLE